MSIYVAKNFKRSEFQCSCGCGKDRPIDSKLLYLLQSLRNKIGKPIYITSGLRCKAYNKRINGYRYSPHLLGKAVDIHVRGYDIIDLAILAKSVGFPRIGLYPHNHFIHIDTVRVYRNASWIRGKGGGYTYYPTLEKALEAIKL